VLVVALPLALPAMALWRARVGVLGAVLRVASARGVASGGDAFASLGVSAELCASLSALGLSAPTQTQLDVIPSALRGENVLSLAPTGTGKTLALLVPVFHRMKQDETLRRIAGRPHRPRSVVIAPTRELAMQLYDAAKHLSHFSKARVVGLWGGVSKAAQLGSLQQAPLDMVVATPGRLQKLISSNGLSLGDCRYVVLDEADSLVTDDLGAESASDSFSHETGTIIAPLLRGIREGTIRSGAIPLGQDVGVDSPYDATHIPVHHVQFLLAAATLSPAAEAALHKRIPQLSIVRSGACHALPRGISVRFVPIGPGRSAEHRDRIDALVSQVGRAVRHDSRMIIFVGSIPSARAVASSLSERGFHVASLHGGIPPKLRRDEFQTFLTSSKRILVATDAASRGLDFPDVDTVIMFDFPHTGEDFLHRAGRTGRGEAPGLVVCLVGGGRERDFASKAKRALEQRSPLLHLWGHLTRRGAGRAAQPAEKAAPAKVHKSNRKAVPMHSWQSVPPKVDAPLIAKRSKR
jgi:superfamily II DNA/RNA helicase